MTLLGYVGGAPSAHAGCGDHLILLPTDPRQAPASEVAPLTRPPTADSGSPLRPHTPCSGPYCSRAPLLPPLAPAVPVTMPGPEWACTVGHLVLAAADDFSLLPDEPAAAPAFRGDSVFHPPR
jgi:hypothetical protein